MRIYRRQKKVGALEDLQITILFLSLLLISVSQCPRFTLASVTARPACGGYEDPEVRNVGGRCLNIGVQQVSVRFSLFISLYQVLEADVQGGASAPCPAHQPTSFQDQSTTPSRCDSLITIISAGLTAEPGSGRTGAEVWTHTCGTVALLPPFLVG